MVREFSQNVYEQIVLTDPTPATLGEVYRDWPSDGLAVKKLSLHALPSKPRSVVVRLEVVRAKGEEDASPQTLHLQYEITELVQLLRSLLKLLDPSPQEQILEQLKRIQSQ